MDRDRDIDNEGNEDNETSPLFQPTHSIEILQIRSIQLQRQRRKQL